MRIQALLLIGPISLFHVNTWGAFGKGLPTEMVAQYFLLTLVYTF